MRAGIWASTSCSAVDDVASGRFRLRVVFRKSGRLRWLSHLEVTRSLERGVRRAGLPYALTQGFNPHMKIAFGPALPVGTGGEREIFDVWLGEYVPAGETLERLNACLAPDLALVEVHYVAESEPSLSSGVLIGVYDVCIDGKELRAEEVATALEKVRSAGTLEVEHRRKTKVFDLARCLPKEPRASDSDAGVRVSLSIRMGPEGSLRPDVLLKAALTAAHIRGVVTDVTRTDTLIENEEGVWLRPA